MCRLISRGTGGDPRFVAYFIRKYSLTAQKVESFEAVLEVTGLDDPSVPFTGIFIRAPVCIFRSHFGSHLCSPPQVVLALAPDAPIQVIARLPPNLLPVPVEDENDPRTIVALRQGLHLLTTFHPELTQDDRFHKYFARKCVFPTVPAS